MINQNYGKYSIPTKLHQLIDLQNNLNKEGFLKYGDLLGYYFSLDGLDSRYLNTPLDVISFARPGADGIHFGFLTEFGQVCDLDSAYIVRVSPMDFDNPVKIVARNLNDFMRLIFYYPNAMEILDITQNKSLVEEFLKESREATIITDKENKVKGKFNKLFQLEPIESLHIYLQSIKKERENEIVFETEDSIGIVSKNMTCKNAIEKQLFNFNGKGILNTDDIKKFFNHSSYEAKLAFLRDAQSKGLIFDNLELKHYLKEQLPFLQLHDEAERVFHP